MAKQLESKLAHVAPYVAGLGVFIVGIPLLGALGASAWDWATHLDDNFAALNAEFASAETTDVRKEQLGGWRYYVEGVTPHADQMQLLNLRENPIDKLVGSATLGALLTTLFFVGRASRRG